MAPVTIKILVHNRASHIETHLVTSGPRAGSAFHHSEVDVVSTTSGRGLMGKSNIPLILGGRRFKKIVKNNVSLSLLKQ